MDGYPLAPVYVNEQGIGPALTLSRQFTNSMFYTKPPIFEIYPRMGCNMTYETCDVTLDKTCDMTCDVPVNNE